MLMHGLNGFHVHCNCQEHAARYPDHKGDTAGWTAHAHLQHQVLLLIREGLLELGPSCIELAVLAGLDALVCLLIPVPLPCRELELAL